MANKLGAAFLRCSLGPLNYAGGCILQSKVADGLGELSADNLHGGLTRGISEAARNVGVRPADIERLLPMAEIQAAAARLDQAQQSALHAWGAHAGQIGGLLKGVADLTVDGRAPDVSNFLERLSKKVVRDPPLSEPLHTLSIEIASWLDLVEKCGEILADGGVLTRAYRRRRIQQGLLAAACVAALATALVFALRLRAARGRVDAALSVFDPCAALDIDPDDLGRASSAQQQRATERQAACDARRKQEAAAREAQQKREAEAREVERGRKDHETRCDALAGRLEGGSVLPEDGDLAQGKIDLLGRVARHALDRGDLKAADLPCADTPAGARIAAAFGVAVVKSPAAWANAEDVSERVRAILVDHRAELPPAAVQQVGRTADNLAKRATIQRTAVAVEQATRICKLKDDLGVRGAKFCAAVGVLHAAGKL
jgi:hypothetical protein